MGSLVRAQEREQVKSHLRMAFFVELIWARSLSRIRNCWRNEKQILVRGAQEREQVKSHLRMAFFVELIWARSLSRIRNCWRNEKQILVRGDQEREQRQEGVGVWRVRLLEEKGLEHVCFKPFLFAYYLHTVLARLMTCYDSEIKLRSYQTNL